MNDNYPHKKISVSIIANGCHESFMDAGLYNSYFKENNKFQVTEDYLYADLIFFLGCCGQEHKELESRDLIKHILKTKAKDSELLVLGCMSRIYPELKYNFNGLSSLTNDISEELFYGDLESNLESEVFANKPYGLRNVRLSEFLNDRRINGYIPNINKSIEKITSRFYKLSFNALKEIKDFFESRIDIFNDNTFSIKISSGCLGNCSYCLIKSSRGRVKSKSINNILKEFKLGLDQGYRDFVLLGTDIGDYGKDHGTNLLDLLNEILNSNDKIRLWLRNVNPKWLIASFNNFYDLLKSKKIVYILSPVQSGNNHILNLMNRGYTIENFIDCIDKIRNLNSSIVLQTQLIVGFPGEGEAEFKDSLNLLDHSLFDYIEVFRYSNRPNTRASTLDRQVPKDVIWQRYKKIFLKSLFSRPLRKAAIIKYLNPKR